jgi:hypothetical protein
LHNPIEDFSKYVNTGSDNQIMGQRAIIGSLLNGSDQFTVGLLEWGMLKPENMYGLIEWKN